MRSRTLCGMRAFRPSSCPHIGRGRSATGQRLPCAVRREEPTDRHDLGARVLCGDRAGRRSPRGGMDVMYISLFARDDAGVHRRPAPCGRAPWASRRKRPRNCCSTRMTRTRRSTPFRIKFASGFEIMALSSAPRGLRIKQGVVIIDEAAFVDNLKELLKAALALPGRPGRRLFHP